MREGEKEEDRGDKKREEVGDGREGKRQKRILNGDKSAAARDEQK